MANIPQYQSKGRLINEGPQVQQSVAEAVRLGEGANLQTLSKGVSDVGNAVMDIQDQIAKVDNANNVSKAEIDRTKLLYDAEEKRKGMSATDALKDVETLTPKLTQQVANQYFKNPAFKQAYLREQEVQDAGYIIQQKAHIAKGIVSERRVLTLRDRDLAISNGINAETDAQRAQADAKMVAVINNPANKDIYTPEEQYKLIEDGRKEIQQGIKDKQALTAKQNKEIQLARDFARTQKEQDLVIKRVDNQLTPREVRQAMEGDNPIDARVGQSLINSLKSPKTVAAKTDYEVYGSIMKDIFNPKKTATEIMATVTDEYGKGNLSTQDYKALLYSKKLGQEPIFTKAQAEGEAKADPVKAIWESVVRNFSNPRDRAEVMGGVVGALQTGGESLENVGKVIGDVTKMYMKKLHSWYLTIPKGGTQIMDADGNVSHMNEEGNLEEGE